MADTVGFEIMEHVGTISKRNDFGSEIGWSKEVNIVVWNGGEPKFDIREWDSTHERMTRGLTLYEDEARALAKILAQHFL